MTSTSDKGSGPSGEDPRPGTPLGCSLGPVSSMFLAHFVAETSRVMAIVSPEKNPFLTHMLPMAFSDELILHSLLALGGAHLECKQSSPEISTWVCRYYGRVICRLQDIISQKPNEPIEWPRALLALLILYVIGVCQSLTPWILGNWEINESGRICYGSLKRSRHLLLNPILNTLGLTRYSLGFEPNARWRCSYAHSGRAKTRPPTAKCFLGNE